MSMVIDTAQCTVCGICEPVCPTESIREYKGSYVIDPVKCTECEGEAQTPQCVDNCPVDGCISRVSA